MCVYIVVFTTSLANFHRQCCSGQGLTPFEGLMLQVYHEAWKKERGTDPMLDSRAVYVLNQNPERGFGSMTSTAGALPCITSSSTRRMWIPSRGRHSAIIGKKPAPNFKCIYIYIHARCIYAQRRYHPPGRRVLDTEGCSKPPPSPPSPDAVRPWPSPKQTSVKARLHVYFMFTYIYVHFLFFI